MRQADRAQEDPAIRTHPSPAEKGALIENRRGSHWFKSRLGEFRALVDEKGRSGRKEEARRGSAGSEHYSRRAFEFKTRNHATDIRLGSDG
ncbi:MAG TPA: hypothetical protein DIS93_03075 [Bdellovibrionales bacterium]|nr:hypothetical protein [Bdellovibrionales bacterium]